jgi:aminoglycoside phosphotransferase
MLPVCIRDELKNLGLDVPQDSVRIQAGLSGARVYRAGDYAIKQHPLSRLERLARIHQYQHRWADSFPDWIPKLVSWPSSLSQAIPTILVLDDGTPQGQGCWEGIEWMPGESIGRIEQVRIEQVQAVARALGLLHRHSKHGCPISEASSDCDDRLQQRDRLLQQLVESQFRSPQMSLDQISQYSKGNSLSDPWIDRLRVSLGTARLIAFESGRALQKLCRSTTLRYPIHGDAWRGNWLFEGMNVSGLIDFSQADIRWPGFDFSRAIGTMALSNRTLWNEAWNSYCEVLGDAGYRLDEAILMHRVSTILTLVNYIDRLGRSEAIEPVAWVRIEEICRDLSSMNRDDQR